MAHASLGRKVRRKEKETRGNPERSANQKPVLRTAAQHSTRASRKQSQRVLRTRSANLLGSAKNARSPKRKYKKRRRINATPNKTANLPRKPRKPRNMARRNQSTDLQHNKEPKRNSHNNHNNPNNSNLSPSLNTNLTPHNNKSTKLNLNPNSNSSSLISSHCNSNSHRPFNTNNYKHHFNCHCSYKPTNNYRSSYNSTRACYHSNLKHNCNSNNPSSTLPFTLNPTLRLTTSTSPNHNTSSNNSHSSKHTSNHKSKPTQSKRSPSKAIKCSKCSQRKLPRRSN